MVKYEAIIKVVIEADGNPSNLRSIPEINGAITESLVCDGVSYVEIIEAKIETKGN